MFILVHLPGNIVPISKELEKKENIYQVPQIYDLHVVISVLKQCLSDMGKLQKLEQLINILNFQFYVFKPDTVKFEGLEELLNDLCQILKQFHSELKIEHKVLPPNVQFLYHLLENLESFKKLWRRQYQVEKGENLINLDLLKHVKKCKEEFAPILCALSTLIPLHFTQAFQK